MPVSEGSGNFLSVLVGYLCQQGYECHNLSVYLKEKNNMNEEMNPFVIRTYGRTELAQLYCPNLCPEAAFRKLKHWIDLCPGLRDGLSDLGVSSRSRSYTPAQVRLIVELLGEP